VFAAGWSFLFLGGRKMKRRLFGIGVLALVLVLLFAACGGGTTPADASPAGDVQTIGQGDTVFRFEMIDESNALHAWDVHTEEATVGAALLEVGLIAGDESEWGLMVTQVNGVTADFDADGAFWAFHIDGDFAMAGVDATYIEPGVNYAFIYTQG